MAVVNPSLSVITLNVIELTIQIKNHRWQNGEQDSTMYYLQEIHFRSETLISWKWKHGQRYSMQTVNKREQGWLIIISDKIVFKPKKVFQGTKNFTM